VHEPLRECRRESTRADRQRETDRVEDEAGGTAIDGAGYGGRPGQDGAGCRADPERERAGRSPLPDGNDDAERERDEDDHDFYVKGDPVQTDAYALAAMNAMVTWFEERLM
jgi:hypothetical protein